MHLNILFEHMLCERKRFLQFYGCDSNSIVCVHFLVTYVSCVCDEDADTVVTKDAAFFLCACFSSMETSTIDLKL